MTETRERPLTVKQVAELLCVAPSTVVNYADRGELPYWRLPSGHRRFRRADLEKFMPPKEDEATA